MIVRLLGSLRKPWLATALPSVISFIAPQLGGLTPTSSLQRPPGIRPQPFVNQRQFATLLDGGRILVGILPKPAAMAVARLEPFGLVILIGLLIIVPMLGAQLGVNLNFISGVLAIATRSIVNVIVYVTGNS
jgi:uncharacterized membrane protein